MNVIHLLAGILMAMAATPSDMTTIARGTLSGVERPREAVIRTSQEWGALWKEHAPERTPPAVDFATRTVIAVFIGTRPSAGFDVEIVNVAPDATAAAAAVVHYRERRPGAGEMTAQILTSPFHIVSVPRLEGRARFERVDAAAR